MNAPGGGEAGVAAFRAKLLAGMAFVVGVLTLSGLYLAERSVSAETQHDLKRAFNAELALLRTVREIRHATLAERCRALVRKPRIIAALEDNALDLLYPSAKDELGDTLSPGDGAGDGSAERSIRPRFYRFLDGDGALIAPVSAPEVGALAPDEEKRLGFASLPREQQTGYLARSGSEIVELVATPIISTETGEPMAALVAGFPVAADEPRGAGLLSGMWLDGRLHMPSLDHAAREALVGEVTRALAYGRESAAKGTSIRLQGAEQMLFIEQLNPGALFPPAYEVGVYPLAELLGRQWRLRRNAAVAGLVLLALGIATSFYISARLALPVRELAAISAENRVLRERAETALEIKSSELERTARFSADASHQLKTPVAVLRAGLDELAQRDEFTSETRDEIALLAHQTLRLSGIIDDLLLLSRLDSGRLQLNLVPVDLAHVIETCVDDMNLFYENDVPEVEVTLPNALHVSGEMRYTMLIVQNLLDNARKYGRPDEPIRVTARVESGSVILVVANRGDAIPRASWEPIFERFHRAAVGESIAGYGLGLNLARDLARLHGGDVRLVRSDGEWTEFEAHFVRADAPARKLTPA